MPGPQPERSEVRYAGRVQGVGFRYTVRSLARGFAVSGYVKNLRDGRVELVVEGEPAEIDRFLAAVQREMGYYVGQVEQTRGAATGTLVGFEIRF